MQATPTESSPLLYPQGSSRFQVPFQQEDLDEQLIAQPDLARNERSWLRHAPHELYFLLRSSFPITLTILFQTSVTTFSTVFLGRLGTTELASSSLASLYMMLTGYSLILGTASALDTLAAQAFTSALDSSSPNLLGILLQRAIAILYFLLLPFVALLWLIAEPVLVHLLHQDPELARNASRVIYIQFFALPAMILFECIKRFLQAQGIMRASAYTLFCTAPIGVYLCYLLILHTPLGLLGAPMANVTNWWIMLLGLLIYLWVNPKSRKHWNGLHPKEAFHSWRPFIHLGIPGFLMMASEMWALEACILSASYFGPIALASQSIAFESARLGGFIFISFGIAVSNRIGNLLGAAKACHARLAAWTSLGLVLLLSSIYSLLFIIYRDAWASIFTRDPEVHAMVIRLLPLISLFQLVQSIGIMCGGILKGMGKQKIAAILRVICIYLIGLPLALWLCFMAGWGILGLWSALLVGMTLSALAELYVLIRVDWDLEVTKCHDRIQNANRETSR
ncbi:MAG: mate-domain-containing protein [Piptocephalis tieghemiana]|nr:MAG: mate-domain-containing protein [Piptocephalis tieghemiana]